MPPSLRSTPKKTGRATQGDEGSAAQASRPSGRKTATQPQPKPSIADDVVNKAISQTGQTSGLRAIRLRLNLGGGIRKSSPARRSRSATPNRPPPSAQARARSVSSTSSTESLSPSLPEQAATQPAQPTTPLWKKSLSPISSYVDPDEHRVPTTLQEEEDDNIKDIEEEEKENDDDEETRRIYSSYTINFVAKLGKEIYHNNTFPPDKFDVNKLCINIFNRAKKTINSETHKLIWSQQEIGLVAIITAKGVSKPVYQSIGP